MISDLALPGVGDIRFTIRQYLICILILYRFNIDVTTDMVYSVNVFRVLITGGWHMICSIPGHIIQNDCYDVLLVYMLYYRQTKE